jgi:8-oxo-dGTP pyrophosphatase MutT (NUDIX family)
LVNHLLRYEQIILSIVTERLICGTSDAIQGKWLQLRWKAEETIHLEELGEVEELFDRERLVAEGDIPVAEREEETLLRIRDDRFGQDFQGFLAEHQVLVVLHQRQEVLQQAVRVDIVPDECIARFRDKDFGLPEDGDESTFITRTASRAVLVDKDYRVALVNATNRGYYKLPGGGIDEGELISEALHREVIEEAGYKIDILRPLGYTHETRHKFEQFNVSYAFLARVTEFVGNKLEEDEVEDGFELEWFDNIDDAIAAVEKVDTSKMVYQAQFFTARELAILRAARKVLKEQYGQ